MSHAIIAPGMRIELRNEEWLVRRVDATQSGGQQLSCIGLSEFSNSHYDTNRIK